MKFTSHRSFKNPQVGGPQHPPLSGGQGSRGERRCSWALGSMGGHVFVQRPSLWGTALLLLQGVPAGSLQGVPAGSGSPSAPACSRLPSPRGVGMGFMLSYGPQNRVQAGLVTKARTTGVTLGTLPRGATLLVRATMKNKKGPLCVSDLAAPRWGRGRC